MGRRRQPPLADVAHVLAESHRPDRGGRFLRRPDGDLPSLVRPGPPRARSATHPPRWRSSPWTSKSTRSSTNSTCSCDISPSSNSSLTNFEPSCVSFPRLRPLKLESTIPFTSQTHSEPSGERWDHILGAIRGVHSSATSTRAGSSLHRPAGTLELLRDVRLVMITQDS